VRQFKMEPALWCVARMSGREEQRHCRALGAPTPSEQHPGWRRQWTWPGLHRVPGFSGSICLHDDFFRSTVSVLKPDPTVPQLGHMTELAGHLYLQFFFA
jgi:hypothetical protein